LTEVFVQLPPEIGTTKRNSWWLELISEGTEIPRRGSHLTPPKWRREPTKQGRSGSGTQSFLGRLRLQKHGTTRRVRPRSCSRDCGHSPRAGCPSRRAHHIWL